ncbi:hypothetical protein N9933_03460 [bacterium]|nr:hypothetical protein [bacterium]
MNWREISKVGTPTDHNKSYLVTDGKEVSTTNISTAIYISGVVKFTGWIGDENTFEDNQCCSGERGFDLTPTHWLPTDEIVLPSI